MPLLEANGSRIFFAHIPKTGGTSVEAYMATKGRLSMMSGDQRPVPGDPVTQQHYHRELYLPKLADTGVDAWFAILRNPLDRLVSEYRFRLKARPGFHALDPRIWFGRWPVKVGRQHLRLTFEEWVEAVFSAYAEDPCVNDNHIRPQSDFVCEGMTLFDFENGLNPVFDWIDAQTDGTRSQGRYEAKRSSGRRPAVTHALRQRVLDFYREDANLLAQLSGKREAIA
ncbi:sulfotransferase family 2 domain-containing protein [Rhodosalinus sp. K401]|uniref:sulfotransferase family 2 domain-containing protein n=1 Tax=Rhodosalinus sp. K401 TaxID=3239195 RepID=UPI00352561FD